MLAPSESKENWTPLINCQKSHHHGGFQGVVDNTNIIIYILMRVCIGNHWQQLHKHLPPCKPLHTFVSHRYVCSCVCWFSWCLCARMPPFVYVYVCVCVCFCVWLWRPQFLHRDVIYFGIVHRTIKSKFRLTLEWRIFWGAFWSGVLVWDC